jgi:hypothetical protein
MARLRHRAVGTVALSAISILFLATPALAGGPLWGNTTKDGARLNLKDQAELRQIKADQAAAKAAKAQKYQYASVANCPGATPDNPGADELCTAAALACAGNTPQQGLGPSVNLFRRTVNAAGGPTGPWVQYGSTCFPEDAPGARPTLGMAQILAAFHDTPFAKPTLEIQPKGNITLVTLPTYFEVRWDQAGVEPGEIDHPDPARLLGYRVEIRPQVESIVYVYGDGSTSEPTRSLGGPYPEGDVTKAYARGGDYAVRADVTYTGQFRVGNGEWIDIPGTVTIQGAPETLQVKTAKARLYSSPR